MATEPEPTPDDAYAALRLPPVRRYLAGRFAAAVGRQMVGVAIGWQIYDRTSSTFALGMVGLVQVIPVVVLALPVGHLVDRKNRRDVAVASTAALAACAAALTLLSHFHGPLWGIYATLFANGIATAFEGPSTSSLMAQITPPRLYANANTWQTSSWQLAATGGPGLAGALIAFGHGTTLVYLVDVVGGLCFFAALASIERPPTPAPTQGDPRKELRAGLHFVFSTPLLLSAITLDLFAVLLGGATALLPAFARDILHVGPSGLGWLRAAPSVGAFVMAIVATRIAPWQRAGRALLITVAGFGLATLGFALSRSFWLSALCLALTGAFDNVSMIIRRTLEQLITPDRLRGRVSAVHYVFIGLSNEMGEFESGVTASLLGPVGSVLLGGIGTLVIVIVVAVAWPVLRKLGPLSSVRAVDPEA